MLWTRGGDETTGGDGKRNWEYIVSQQQEGHPKHDPEPTRTDPRKTRDSDEHDRGRSKGDENDQVQIDKYLLNQTDETLKNSVLNGHDKDQMQTFLDNYVSSGAKNVQVQTLA